MGSHLSSSQDPPSLTGISRATWASPSSRHHQVEHRVWLLSLWFHHVRPWRLRVLVPPELLSCVLLWSYSSIVVFDCLICSIDGNIHEYSWVNFNAWLQHQLLPLVVLSLLQLKQLDFPVAYLENCKRISR